MPNLIFCSNCGNDDRESFSHTDDNEFRVYKCDLCNTVIDKVSITIFNQNLGKGGIKK